MFTFRGSRRKVTPRGHEHAAGGCALRLKHADVETPQQGASTSAALLAVTPHRAPGPWMRSEARGRQGQGSGAEQVDKGAGLGQMELAGCPEKRHQRAEGRVGGLRGPGAAPAWRLSGLRPTMLLLECGVKHLAFPLSAVGRLCILSRVGVDAPPWGCCKETQEFQEHHFCSFCLSMSSWQPFSPWEWGDGEQTFQYFP